MKFVGVVKDIKRSKQKGLDKTGKNSVKGKSFMPALPAYVGSISNICGYQICE